MNKKQVLKNNEKLVKLLSEIKIEDCTFYVAALDEFADQVSYMDFSSSHRGVLGKSESETFADLKTVVKERGVALYRKTKRGMRLVWEKKFID